MSTQALVEALRDADGYLAADDAEERDDPRNIRRHLRAKIRAALAAADARPAEHGAREAWWPIETAPKDGTYVLLWSPDADPDLPFIGRWVDDGDMPDGGAWWEDGDGPFPIDADPSHWQPLPAPPAGGEE